MYIVTLRCFFSLVSLIGQSQRHTNTFCFFWNTHSFFPVYGILFLSIVRPIFSPSNMFVSVQVGKCSFVGCVFFLGCFITLSNILIWDLIPSTLPHSGVVLRKKYHKLSNIHHVFIHFVCILYICVVYAGFVQLCNNNSSSCFREQFMNCSLSRCFMF